MKIESSYIRAAAVTIVAVGVFAACRTPVIKQLAQGVISKLPTTALPYATHNLAGRIAAGSASTPMGALLFWALTPKKQPSTSTPPGSHNESGMHISGRGVKLKECASEMLEYDPQKECYYITMLTPGLPRGWESPQGWTSDQLLPKESYEALYAVLGYDLREYEAHYTILGYDPR